MLCNIKTKTMWLILLAVLLAVISFVVIFKRKEGLANTTEDENKDTLADDILNFLKEDTEYKDYLDYLSTIPYNLSMKILDQDVFFELRFMVKNNTLTKNKIKEYITDM